MRHGALVRFGAVVGMMMLACTASETPLQVGSRA